MYMSIALFPEEGKEWLSKCNAFCWRDEQTVGLSRVCFPVPGPCLAGSLTGAVAS